MKKLTDTLKKQLLVIFIINLSVIVIFLGNIIPNLVSNRYENSIYNRLKEQLSNLDKEIDKHTNIGDIAFIYVENDIYFLSPNACKLIGRNDCYDIVNYLDKEKGKITYDNKIFYYYKIQEEDVIKVAITSATPIKKTENAILELAISILLFVFIGIFLITSFWSRNVVNKIEKLKEKVDNIDNDQYDHRLRLKSDDELRSLELAIEDMRISSAKQEELRNQLYQNISHDFKTPLTVIKSYIEAVDDGVEDKDEAFKVILEQTNKLEKKVHSLLYLNKLEYLKDTSFDLSKQVDIGQIINSSIDKFKHQNNQVEIVKNIDKNNKFCGTEDIWETIIDNLLNNFYRYAEKKIKITVKSNKIILYNDGPNIDEDLKKVLFTPFRKGIKGQFGLGLSIVKKSLTMLGYDIEIENHTKKGVSFIISRKGS